MSIQTMNEGAQENNLFVKKPDPITKKILTDLISHQKKV